ncbi:hypothetical protein L0F63_003618, partial [Massospora cicadina]
MPDLGDDIRLDATEDVNLYSVLCLEKNCDSKSIKKAYYKLALQFHPDKISPDCEESVKEKHTKKFQHIGFAYSILSDPQKREHYDKTGSWDEAHIECSTFEEWTSFFDAHFGGKVSSESIEKLRNKYQHSIEERDDVIEAYKINKGDMNKILDSIILSSTNDEKRFMEYIESAIEAGDLKRFPKFTQTTTEKAHKARVRKEEKEAKELELSVEDDEKKTHKGSKGKDHNTDSLESLAQLIKANQNNREANSDAFFERLANRYSGIRKQTPASSDKAKKTTKKSRSESDLAESSMDDFKSKRQAKNKK